MNRVVPLTATGYHPHDSMDHETPYMPTPFEIHNACLVVPPVETRALWPVLGRALLVVYFLGFLPSEESLIGFLLCFLRV